MATAAVTLPKPRRRPANPLTGGRATFPEVYFIKHIDNSRLIREVGLEKCRECFSLLGLGILVFLSILFFSWQHLQCVRAGYQIEELKAKFAAQQEWNRQLLLQQAALADPQRIDTLARKNLGMISPSPQQVIQWGGPDASSAPQQGNAELARNFTAAGEPNAGEP